MVIDRIPLDEVVAHCYQLVNSCYQTSSGMLKGLADPFEIRFQFMLKRNISAIAAPSNRSFTSITRDTSGFIFTKITSKHVLFAFVEHETEVCAYAILFNDDNNGIKKISGFQFPSEVFYQECIGDGLFADIHDFEESGDALTKHYLARLKTVDLKMKLKQYELETLNLASALAKTVNHSSDSLGTADHRRECRSTLPSPVLNTEQRGAAQMDSKLLNELRDSLIGRRIKLEKTMMHCTGLNRITLEVIEAEALHSDRIMEMVLEYKQILREISSIDEQLKNPTGITTGTQQGTSLFVFGKSGFEVAFVETFRDITKLYRTQSYPHRKEIDGHPASGPGWLIFGEGFVHGPSKGFYDFKEENGIVTALFMGFPVVDTVGFTEAAETFFTADRFGKLFSGTAEIAREDQDRAEELIHLRFLELRAECERREDKKRIKALSEKVKDAETLTSIEKPKTNTGPVDTVDRCKDKPWYFLGMPEAFMKLALELEKHPEQKQTTELLKKVDLNAPKIRLNNRKNAASIEWWSEWIDESERYIFKLRNELEVKDVRRMKRDDSKNVSSTK